MHDLIDTLQVIHLLGTEEDIRRRFSDTQKPAVDWLAFLEVGFLHLDPSILLYCQSWCTHLHAATSFLRCPSHEWLGS